PERVLASVHGALAGQRLLDAEAELRAPLAQVQSLEALARAPISLTAQAGPVSVAQLGRLRSAFLEQDGDLSPGEGFAAVDNSGFPTGAGVSALEPIATTRAGGPQVTFDGRARATLTLGGTLADPDARLQLGFTELGRGHLALGKADVTWTYSDTRNALDAVLTAPGGGKLELTGTTTLDLSLPSLRSGLDLEHARVDARLDSQDFALDFLSGATQTVRRVGGILDAHAKVSGPLLTPALDGDVEWRNGRVTLAGLGEYRDVHLKVTGSRERIRLEDLSARSGAGSARLAGEADRSGGQYQLRAKGRVDRFPVVYDDQLLAVASLDNFSLSGTLSSEALYIQRLSVPGATVELPEVRRKDLQQLDRPGDIVLTRNGAPVNVAQRKRTLASRRAARNGPTPDAGGAGQGTGQGDLRFTVLLNAPRNVWVKGTDVNIELGFSDPFRIEYTDRASIFGEVRVLRGRVGVLGREFDIQRDSQLRFTGPASQPFINVSAVHTNDRENVTVTMAIRGQGKDFTVKPTSEPPMTETEIYTLLATGRRTLELNSGSATGSASAVSVVGNLLAGQAQRVLAGKLPLDVLSIEAGENLLQGARFEVGHYLGDKLYVGYSHRFRGAGMNEDTGSARLEYQIDPRWSLEGEVGVGGRGESGADLIWSTEF
ncbi:MAG: translocation/assembly module TamB, partial [Myxococcaceae bacterium]|nr:translocation/assembly module TamB [Myxococcaceae bacterium]